MKKIRLILFLSVFFLVFPLINSSFCETIPDNNIDEDSDGWLDTTYGFQIRASHPRVVTTPDKLQVILSRMYGQGAREPYSKWFELVKEKEDQDSSVSLCNLALIYLATGDDGYLQKLINRWPTSGDPSTSELYALDLVYDEIPDSIKTNIMQRVSSNNNCWYWDSVAKSDYSDVSWGYHNAIGVAPALAYSGIFALTDLEFNKDADIYRYNCLNYLALTHEELSPTGYFYRIERHIAGAPTSNDALPGSPGGVYDNFGYDRGEESYSIHVINEYENITGNDIADDFFHDKYRATLWQNFQYPHQHNKYENNAWAHRAGTETHNQARVWFAQIDISMPATHAAALTASRYKDPRMQDYAVNGTDVELTGYDFDIAFWYLVYFDDSIIPEPPQTNPTAYYASGPGLVSMRNDWDNDSAFGYFLCGDGISRRYEDANSFEIHRKADVIPQAGARIRRNPDNDKHHWYTVRSASRNTLKIFDPDECNDRNPGDNRRGSLHSGTPLVQSSNLGGQMFETAPPADNNSYSLGSMPAGVQDNGLSYNETGNIIKFENVPGEYTYTVGDGTEAYTRKIDYFEREFLYLRPDVFVIFDRVQSVNPSFKKVWTIHTIDEPVAVDETYHGMGYKTSDNGRSVSISNPLNTTYIDALFPENNLIKIRGGDTILTKGKGLSASQPLSENDFLECDIPRWLEVFAIGSDVEGSITIRGDAEEGDNVSEIVEFGSKVQNYVSSRPTATTSTTLTDDSQNWDENQWAGYVLRLRGGSGEDTLITGNDENTLFVDEYANSGVWGYNVMRPLANTYNHWKKIVSVTTSDMNIDNLIISAPHYFDTEDATGKLYSFAPHTDSIHDRSYTKSTGIGQWTLEIEAETPKTGDVFLNVISLKDPGVDRPVVTGFKGDGITGTIIDDKFVVFADGKTSLENVNVSVPGDGIYQGIFCDLEPETEYSHSISGNTITLTKGAGNRSSAMGILKVSVTLSEKTDPDPDLTSENVDNENEIAEENSGSCFISGIMEE